MSANDKKFVLKRKTAEELETYFDQRGLLPTSQSPVSPNTVSADVLLTAADIGKMVEGKGIYIGTWKADHPEGKFSFEAGGLELYPPGLKEVFNVFAAPEDLKDTLGERLEVTFNKASRHLDALKNWHGYDGHGFADYEELYVALRDLTYKGEWIVPPSDIMGLTLLKSEVRQALPGLSTGPDAVPYWGQPMPSTVQDMEGFLPPEQALFKYSSDSSASCMPMDDRKAACLRLVRLEVRR